ncbi:LPS export ABC transporter permease LptG [Porticoccus sp.]
MALLSNYLPMKQLSRYVTTSVLGSIAMVLLVIVSLDAIGAVMDGTGDIENDFTFLQVMIYVAITIPGRIYENIPMASLIGCLIGLGVLANNSELVVMRSAGVSVLRIVWFVIRPILWLILAGALLGEYVVPYSDQYADSRRMLLSGGKSAQESGSGFWNKEGNDFMHFNAVYPGGVLFGVTRFRFDESHKLLQSSFAERATFQGENWLEERGVVTDFHDEGTEVSEFVTREWETNLSPELLNLIVFPPDSLPIGSLYNYSEYLQEQGQDSSKYELAFWGKALQPLTIISLVLIAISFVFGPLREVTMGYRIFAGVLVGLVFRTLQDLLGPASIVYGIPPLLSVITPALICALIGLWMLRRAA